MKKYDWLNFAFITLLVSGMLVVIAGWVSNIIWLIGNGLDSWNGEVVISVLGVVLAPIGTIHGIYTWF